ncbi:hypothetical protein GX48_00783 [Paracoccidioides brasiliensis]|nr:hypothetical protein GX48_00783 [Paracoccidioides brasiliensis]
MRSCGSSAALESSGLLASPSPSSSPTADGAGAVAAGCGRYYSRAYQVVEAPALLKSSRCPRSSPISAHTAHTAHRLRPRGLSSWLAALAALPSAGTQLKNMIASSPTSAALLRTDSARSPASSNIAFPACTHYYGTTTSPPPTSHHHPHLPPPPSPSISRPRRPLSDPQHSFGIEEIRSALRRQTVDVGTQYSPPPTPANKPAPPPPPVSAANETKFTDNITNAHSGPQQGQESIPPQTDSQMPSTLVGSKRNTPDTASLYSTARENAQSIEPDSPSGSLSKRPRPEKPAAKVLPRRYEEVNPRDLVVLISSMLMELIRFNDQIPLRDGRLTRFHSRSPPRISVQDYLQRLTTHATLSPPILLSMVFYIDRLCALYPAFTVSTLTVHRFLISSATVASKGLSDSFWTNKTYARVGGISVAELALLELEFLWRVEWRIVPQPEVLEDYYRNLVERCDEYVILPEEDDDKIHPTGGEAAPASHVANGGEASSSTMQQ